MHKSIVFDYIQKWSILSGRTSATCLHTLSKRIGHGDMDMGRTWRVSVTTYISYIVDPLLFAQTQLCHTI